MVSKEVLYAATISSTVMSTAPNAMEAWNIRFDS
jgi:hypothetical protein